MRKKKKHKICQEINVCWDLLTILSVMLEIGEGNDLKLPTGFLTSVNVDLSISNNKRQTFEGRKMSLFPVQTHFIDNNRASCVSALADWLGVLFFLNQSIKTASKMHRIVFEEPSLAMAKSRF